MAEVIKMQGPLDGVIILRCEVMGGKVNNLNPQITGKIGDDQLSVAMELFVIQIGKITEALLVEREKAMKQETPPPPAYKEREAPRLEDILKGVEEDGKKTQNP